MTEVAEPAGDARKALEQAALSDIGLRRGSNQDAFAVALAADETDWRRRGHLLLVADGMGAHAAGELASKIASESLPHTYRKTLDRSPADALKHAVVTTNANIHQRGQANAEFQGMGTTCSALVLLPRQAIVAHVGDSRVYRLRRGKLEQLTFDHSLVWEMMAAGQMPRGDVASFIPKNIITRSLGPHPDVQVDLEGPFPLEPGDTFLLCSDGLSGQVKDEEMGALLGALSPSEAVRSLVDVANLRGGPDNITAIVARVVAVPLAEPNEAVAEPPVSGNSSASPIWWGLVALCLLAGLVLAVSEYYVAALVSVLVGVASAVAALVQGLNSPPPREPQMGDGPLGTGPHAAFDCSPSAASVTAAAQLAAQLREATRNEHWTLDWGHFNSLGQQAQAALDAGDYTLAVRNYALSISFMMSEIRRQSKKNDHRDSSVL
jgi:protein phosphatase